MRERDNAQTPFESLHTVGETARKRAELKEKEAVRNRGKRGEEERDRRQERSWKNIAEIALMFSIGEFEYRNNNIKLGQEIEQMLGKLYERLFPSDDRDGHGKFITPEEDIERTLEDLLVRVGDQQKDMDLKMMFEFDSREKITDKNFILDFIQGRMEKIKEDQNSMGGTRIESGVRYFDEASVQQKYKEMQKRYEALDKLKEQF